MAERSHRGGVVRPALLALLAGVTVIALAAAAVGLADRRQTTPGADTATAGDVAVTDDRDAQLSMSVATYDGADPSGPATGLMVLAHEPASGQATVLLVPVTLVAEVPGHGAFQLAEAHVFGEAPLVGATLEDLLGIRLDGHAGLSHQEWSELLDRIGGLELDVRSRVVDTTGTPRFEPGSQLLDGARVVEYLTLLGDGETELQVLPRVQQVVTALLDRISGSPELLDRMFLDDAPMRVTADRARFRALLEGLAAARAADELTTLVVPVAALGSGPEELYRLDAARAEQLVAERFTASRPPAGVGQGRAVQIRNGNGVPGVGRQVADLLRDGGYRVVLTGNADRFDYPTTRIVLHGGTDEDLAVGRDVQERLGVGEVELSGTPQSVVDVTIVVGADFPPPD